MDYSLPGSSVYGIVQARILEWVSMPSSRGSSWSKDRTWVSYVSCTGRHVHYYECHMGIPSLGYKVWKRSSCQTLNFSFQFGQLMTTDTHTHTHTHTHAHIYILSSCQVSIRTNSKYSCPYSTTPRTQEMSPKKCKGSRTPSQRFRATPKENQKKERLRQFPWELAIIVGP